MLKIYSKVDPSVLLHMIYTKSDFFSKGERSQRENISPDDAALQLAAIRLYDGMTFKAHKHIPCVKQTEITQESWIIISGRVKAILYDLDNTIIHEQILLPGDCSITFLGGHNYLSLEEDSIIYEAKSGPYFGQEKDKVFINE